MYIPADAESTVNCARMVPATMLRKSTIIYQRTARSYRDAKLPNYPTSDARS